MKHLIILIAFTLISTYCFGSRVMDQEKVVYLIEQSISDSNLLTVSVDRIGSNSPTQLVLRGNAMGVPNQFTKF